MIQLASVKSIRSMDQATIIGGLSGEALMEEAGKGLAHITEKYLDSSLKEKNIGIVCGKGNNGGDGFVAARYLAKNGANVNIVLLADKSELKGDALLNFNKLDNSEIEILSVLDAKDLPDFNTYDILVDAILGTGFSGELQGFIKEVTAKINSSGKIIISADTPSGINCDTGECSLDAIFADATITFGLPKIGQFIYPAKDFIGELHIKAIGLSREAMEENDLGIYIADHRDLSEILPVRSGDVNKRYVGKVLVVGGSKGLTGAAVLSSSSALESGAGVVTAVIPEGLENILEIKLTEEMTIGIGKENAKFFKEEDVAKVLEIAKDFDVMVLGPGLGREETTSLFARKVLRNSPCPVVLDADALYAFAGQAERILDNPNGTVITPHTGEFLRLFPDADLSTPLKTVETLKKLSETGFNILLKGAPTYISFRDELFVINTTGNAGMATAGSGDVLSGIIASMVAQGLSLFDATVSGAYIHGLSGDIAFEDRTEFCLKAGDLINYLPEAFGELLAG